MKYDIIGDIHGHADALKRLLSKLGYMNVNDTYSHHDSDRKVIFVGDFIDRGPNQREVIEIARNMVRNETAIAVMGNHEYNAITFHQKNNQKPGQYLRERSNKNIQQHLAFLNEYLHDKDSLNDVIEWFKTLPLWFETNELRVIHACWDKKLIDHLKNQHQGEKLTDELLVKSANKDTKEYECIETLLKGKEIKLPSGQYFLDKMGTKRFHIRTKWWDSEVQTYQDAYLGPEDARETITNQELKDNEIQPYSQSDPPVFMGHYWLKGKPKLLSNNIACVDYSVAKSGGQLVAYQFESGKPLSSNHFISVNRD